MQPGCAVFSIASVRCMKPCASSACSGASDGSTLAPAVLIAEKNKPALPAGFFLIIFFQTDADNPPPRFTVMSSYTYVIVVNKPGTFLWTTDKISANSTVWSAHNLGAQPCIERVSAG